jgi:tRNA U38,U39,U40 pseudouridine synthase TruA
MDFFIKGVGPKVSANAFEDLLGGHQFTSSSANQPKTIKDMRRELDLQDVDPETLQVSIPVHSISFLLISTRMKRNM